VTKRLLAIACLIGLCAAPKTAAQDLVITNARIIDGNGGVIPRGAVVVRGGRIVSVSAAGTAPAGVRAIDAKGMTVMPGFIDAHRHVIGGSFPPGDPVVWLKDQAAARMQEFLDAGFTTLQSCGDPVEQIVDLQRRLNAAQIKGPRLFTGAFVQLARPAGRGGGGPLTVDPARLDQSRPPNRPATAAPAIPDEDARASVRALKNAGIDAVKAAIVVTPGGPEKHTLSVIVDEAKKAGMPVIVHAVTVEDTLAALEARPSVLAYTPHIGQLTAEQVKTIVDSGIPMMSTLGVFLPTFAAENQRARERTGMDNTPRFRDLDPFPWQTLASAGQGPVNARLLWNAGITYGYGTDTTFLPKDSLAQELRALRVVFSAEDVVRIMTRNAAMAIGRGKDIGTLEAGKLADLVLLDGDPLAQIENVMKVKMVVKAGAIVVDRRAAR